MEDKNMLLAIDVGNTQTVIGLFDSDKIKASWRMVTPRFETADELGSAVCGFLHNSDYDHKGINEIVISCVVPGMMDELGRMSLKYFECKPLVVDINIKSDLEIRYDHPEEIGADRIANSVAAKEIYGSPAIVVDFGTATTFDIISSKGEYLGGIIAPGIEISSEALFNYAAKLSKVDLHWPGKVVGKNTYDCIRSGILYGFLGQVDFITKRILEEVKENDPGFKPNIIATGGLAFLIASKSVWIKIHDADLTLKGLKILMDKNR
jgi:type III pantothenate kinase